MSTLSRQRALLPSLVAEICGVDSHCGIVLQGSVRNNVERLESDIDLTVVFSVSDTSTLNYNRLITRKNNGEMIRVLDESTQINIDINWYLAAKLKQEFETRGAMHFFIFTYGEILHDPMGLAAECQNAGRRYFEAHPAVAAAWRNQNEALQRHKHDPSYPLEYPRWPDFGKLLARLDP